MAYISQNTPRFAIAGVAQILVVGLGRMANSIIDFYVDVAETQGRVQQIEAMQNLTDRELAEKYGINRDQIAAYVLRDRIWL